MKTLKTMLAAALALVGASPALAIINAPVPTNAYISFGGYDWAWASPCAATAPKCFANEGGFTLSYQASQGWRLPTLAEFAFAPSASDFVFAGANVPFGGVSVEGTNGADAPGDFACAAAYFDSGAYNLCNFGDGAVGAIFGNGGPYTGNPNVDTWVVRGAGDFVPEPASWAMLITGFGLIGAAARRRRAAVAAA